MPVFSLRLLFEAMVAAAISLVLLALGWSFAAEAMLRFAASGLKSVVLEYPAALLTVQLRIGLVCATPPLFAWIAGVAYRLRTRAQPSWARLAACLAGSSVAVVLGFSFQLLVVREGLAQLAEIQGPMDVQPMVGISELSPAASGLRFGIAGALLVLIMNARRKPADRASGRA